MRRSGKLLKNQARGIKDVSVRDMFLALLDSTAITLDIGIPSPIGHTHLASDITDFSEAVDDRISALFLNGTGLTWDYNDTLNAFTPTVSLSPFNSDQLAEGATNLYVTATQKSNWNTAYAWGNHAGLYSLLGHSHTTADITNLSSYTGFDARYYTETEIANFFSGASVITGYNKSNWDTTYAWGNHASAGYLLSSTAASTYVSLSGSYVNPTWITSLGWSKITGTPTTLSGYNITDATSSGRTLTMTGAGNQIFINGVTSAQTFDLSSNRSWIFTLPQSIATGSDVQFGRLGIGTSSGKLVGPFNMQATIESATYNRGLGIISNSNDVTGTPIYVVKSRGATVGSYTAVTSGDQILSLTGFGTDGTGISTNSSASIAFWVEGTVSTNIIPGYMNFRTANSSGALTEAFRVTSAQQVLIGRTTVGTGEQFQVQGTSKFYNLVTLDSHSTVNGNMTFGSVGSIIMSAGTGTETGINMSNRNIIGVNRLEFNDPGPNEGLVWNGGNLWAIYESPNDITTNTGGNMQFVQNGVRKATVTTLGQLDLTASTGTAPLIVTSTTKVGNLNVDLLDGYDSSEFVKISETQTITGLKTFASVLTSSVASGTAPLIITSSTLVSNLNSDLLDGQHGVYFLSRTNHTGTQLASTISDFTTTARGLVSSSITGITYTSSTGVFSNTSGYFIPTTTEQTNWNNAYTNRITALTTSGNSGLATLVTNTLNIPNYTLSGLGGISLTSLSSTATGLTYTNTTGVFSLTSGYVIPTTTQQSNWNTSYAWGNHAGLYYLINETTAITDADAVSPGFKSTGSSFTGSPIAGTSGRNQGYLHTFNWFNAGSYKLQFHYQVNQELEIRVRRYNSDSTPVWQSWNRLWHDGNDGAGSGLDADLLDGQQGSYYLARANHTGTQTASTISDFSTTARGLLSSTATGLTYTSATGVFSLTSGYVIPTTTEQTNWNASYVWGNHASAGYLLSSTASSTYLALSGGTMASNSIIAIDGTAKLRVGHGYMLFTGNTTGGYNIWGQNAVATSSTAMEVYSSNNDGYGAFVNSYYFGLRYYAATGAVTAGTSIPIGASYVFGVTKAGAATFASSVTATSLILSSTITQSLVAGGYAHTLQGSGVNMIMSKWSNTGGNYFVGVASSTGTGLLGSATTAYSFGMVTESARPIVLGTNNTARVTIDGTTGAVVFSNTITSTSIIKSGGTSSQFLKADGSVDSNIYLTTTLAAATYSLIGHTHTTSDIINLSSYTGFDARYYTETEIANFFSGVSAITGYNKSNWDAAYAWGNHAGLYSLLGHTHTTANITDLSSYTGFDARYYTETEISNFFSGSTLKTGYNKSNWDVAYAWGNHASAGYITLGQIPTAYGEVSDGHVSDFSIDDTGWVNITGGATPGPSKEFNPSSGGLVYEGADTIIIAVEASISSVHVVGTGGGGFTANWLYAIAKNGAVINSSIQQFRTDGDVDSCTVICLVEVTMGDVITVKSKAVIGYSDIGQEYFTLKAHRVS